MKQLHVISNGMVPFAKMVEVAKEADFLHIREPNRTMEELCEGVESLLENGGRADAIVINDRIDAAMALGVRSVQLSYRSLGVERVAQAFPKLAAGCSVHSLAEAAAAEAKGAAWLLYGHIFPTSSKAGIPARGLGELARIAACVHIPVIAIGGITLERTNEVLQTGAAGIAVMSGIWEAENPVAMTQKYKEALRRWQR